LDAKQKLDLQDTIDTMIREAQELFDAILPKSAGADRRAKVHRSKWSERHRLHVLLDVAKASAGILPNRIREPWLLAELSAIIDVVKIWKKEPNWREIEPSLVNSTDFSHVVATLMVAEHLRESGHKVELIPTRANASPDLRVQAIGGKQSWIQIECKQPKILSGKPFKLSSAEALKVVNQTMRKGKRQLGNKQPGMLAICTYNQAEPNLDVLRQAIVTRLGSTSRDELAGIIMFSLNNLVTMKPGELSFSPILRFEFMKNPAYFGPIEISDAARSDESLGTGHIIGTQVKEPLTEIVVDDFTLLQREVGKSILDAKSATSTKELESNTRVRAERLPSFKEHPVDRAVVVWEGSQYSRFFKGEGNLNYVCGNCGTCLAERVWKLSCSNIIVQCPTCGLYSEFPVVDPSSFAITQNIGIEPAIYRFANTVFVKRGICLIGVGRRFSRP